MGDSAMEGAAMDEPMAEAPIPIVLISGSTRGASTNTALLRTVMAVAPSSVTTTLFTGMTTLPHFNPDDDRADDGAVAAEQSQPAVAADTATEAAAGATARATTGAAPRLHPAVREMRASLGAARAVLLCTPEYAGALPGSFKNLLDWCVGGGTLYGKPVGWINVSTSPTGASGAHASLGTVLGYLGAEVVADACVHIPVARSQVGADGLIADPAIHARIVSTLDALVGHVATSR